MSVGRQNSPGGQRNGTRQNSRESGTQAHRRPENSSEILDRMPPAAIDSEEALLGSCFLDPDSMDIAFEQLKPEDFYDESHGELFGAMKSHSDENRGRMNLRTLAGHLRDSGQYERIGGGAKIARLAECGGSGAHGAYHAQRIRDASTKRALIMAACDAIRNCYDTSGLTTQEMLDQVAAGLFEVLERGMMTRNNLQGIGEIISETLERLGGDRVTNETITTGYRYLDEQMGGFRRQEMTVIGARPGHGKSALGIRIADRAAASGAAVMFFSLEMRSEELCMRLFAQRSGIPAWRMRNTFLPSEDRQVLIEEASAMSQLPLYIDDTARLNVTQMAAIVRRQIRRAQQIRSCASVDLIVIDYLQLIDTENPREPRHEQVGKITRRLRILARELNCALVVLAQVNRQSGDANRVPKLSELRESGSIEQDSDAVIFIWREHAADFDMLKQMRDEGRPEPATLVIAKQRSGPTGKIELEFHDQQTLFVESNQASSAHDAFDDEDNPPPEIHDRGAF